MHSFFIIASFSSSCCGLIVDSSLVHCNKKSSSGATGTAAQATSVAKKNCNTCNGNKNNSNSYSNTLAAATTAAKTAMPMTAGNSQWKPTVTTLVATWIANAANFVWSLLEIPWWRVELLENSKPASLNPEFAVTVWFFHFEACCVQWCQCWWPWDKRQKCLTNRESRECHR